MNIIIYYYYYYYHHHHHHHYYYCYYYYYYYLSPLYLVQPMSLVYKMLQLFCSYSMQ